MEVLRGPPKVAENAAFDRRELPGDKLSRLLQRQLPIPHEARNAYSVRNDGFSLVSMLLRACQNRGTKVSSVSPKSHCVESKSSSSSCSGSARLRMIAPQQLVLPKFEQRIIYRY
eukprot:COSAG05_NODE_5535_length_1149_cov_1.049524_2_plen_115_part_00